MSSPWPPDSAIPFCAEVITVPPADAAPEVAAAPACDSVAICAEAPSAAYKSSISSSALSAPRTTMCLARLMTRSGLAGLASVMMVYCWPGIALMAFFCAGFRKEGADITEQRGVRRSNGVEFLTSTPFKTG